MPARRRSEAYSVSRIAVFESKPMSIIRPVCKYMLFSRPKILANMKLPARPNGTDKMTAKGMKRLSYRAQRIR